MYPSGAWRGYWEQQIYGRQMMCDLTLNFVNGCIAGSGRDRIGLFTFLGLYDNQGDVVLVKCYEGKHSVLYDGKYDGEGTIFGRWRINEGLSGPFALSPANFEVAADAPILTIAADK
jgi:hypothetical protein